MAWIIFIGIVIVVVAMLPAAMRSTTCPREMLGYNCKGYACDHSEEAIKSAYRSKHHKQMVITDLTRRK